MKVKWGIIGCGDGAERKSGPALYKVKDSELVAVCDSNAEKARKFAQRHGAKRYYTTVEELLKDEDVNAIYVATPVYLHAEHTIKAAEARKNILCEKPMAMNVDECQQIIWKCSEKKVKLMIAYYRRAYPHIRKLKDLLRTKVIGEPMLARVSFSTYYNPTTPGYWKVDPYQAGGGVMMDMGSHRIDLLIYLLGEIEKVSAFIETIHCKYSVEDSAVIILKFKSGPQGIVSFNWNIKKGIDELEIYGTNGKILAKPLDSGRLEVYAEDRMETFILPAPKPTHLGVVRNFVKNLQSGRKMVCPGREGIKTNQVIQAAYESSKRGKVISLRSLSTT